MRRHIHIRTVNRLNNGFYPEWTELSATVVISVRPSARGNGFPEGLKLIIERCSYYKGSVQRWKLKWNERPTRWASLLADHNANLHVYTSVTRFVSRHWILLISQLSDLILGISDYKDFLQLQAPSKNYLQILERKKLLNKWNQNITLFITDILHLLTMHDD